MIRYLALFLLLPGLAWAQCPTVPSACPSPTYNALTVGPGLLKATGNETIGGTLAVTGAVTFTVPPTVANGGTGLSSGTSGGILGFTSTTALASSVLLTQNALVLGGGAGATPTPLGSLGTTTTLLHGNAAGAPTFASVNLAAEVGATILPVANGGTNLASGTSGGILGYTASGVLASSAALGANGLVIGGGAGATPTAIAAGTNGQIPIGVTSGAPVMQTVGGDAILAANGSLTVSKIGGTAITLAAAGTFYPGHSLIGVQTFCASGCTSTGGTYTPDAGTNQVIIEVVAAGGGGGGCGATTASQSCVGGSAASGSYAKGLFTSAFSGITMTVGAAGTAGTNAPGTGGTGGTTSAGALISCPGGTGGPAGVTANITVFQAVVGGATAPAACTTSGGTIIASIGGQLAGYGFAFSNTSGSQYTGQSGSSPLGIGSPAMIGGAATSTGYPGKGYGWGAGGSFSGLSQAATTGLAGGPSLITVYEFN